MTVFTKFCAKSTKIHDHISDIAAKVKAKVDPSLPRGATVLSGIKAAAVVVGKFGSSVPYMQGIVEAANEVIAYAEAMKSNRKESAEIAALTEELVIGLLAETEGIYEDDLSERSLLSLAEIQGKLETIGKAVRDMRKKTFVHELLSKDKHTAQLVDHRRTLQEAVVKFQLMQSVRMDIRVTRMEKKLDDIFSGLCRLAGSSMDGYPAKERVGLPVCAWLSTAMSRALRMGDVVCLPCAPVLALGMFID